MVDDHGWNLQTCLIDGMLVSNVAMHEKSSKLQDRSMRVCALMLSAEGWWLEPEELMMVSLQSFSMLLFSMMLPAIKASTYAVVLHFDDM